MKIRLELVHRTAKVKNVVLKADTVIGRSTECGLRIASNEVSRQHCKVCLGKDGVTVTVRDLGSSNGTFVNGYQLEPDTDYEIAPDSELALGGIKFIVRFSESAAKAARTDGLGSTIDLKPSPQNDAGETEGHEASPSDDLFEETIQFAASDETLKPADAFPREQSETVSFTGPGEVESASEESELEFTAHGDSAILEREDEDSEPTPSPGFGVPQTEDPREDDEDQSLGEFFKNLE